MANKMAEIKKLRTDKQKPLNYKGFRLIETPKNDIIIINKNNKISEVFL